MSIYLTTDATEETRTLLKFEQVKLLYAAMSIIVLSTLINAVMLVAVEWNVINHAVLLSWLMAIFIVTFSRIGLTVYYHKTNPKAEDSSRWETYFTIGSIAAGLLWGSVSVFLFPENTIVHQVFLAFIIGGMCAGAVVSLSVLLIPVVSFLLLALVPLIVRFFMVDSDITTTMGLMLCLFFVTLLINARTSNRNTVENINYRIRNQQQNNTLSEKERDLQTAIQRRELHEAQTSIGIIEWNTDCTVRSWNASAERIFGFTAPDAIGKHATELILSPSAQSSVDDIWQKLLTQQGGNYSINENITQSGETIVCEWNNTPLIEGCDKVIGVYSLVSDISKQQREERFIKETSKILGLVTLGLPEDEIYKTVCLMYESMYPNMKASILRLKGDQLFHCSTPSLPDEYSQAIDGLNIGEGIGSCGTAAFLGKRVIVEDIESHPFWAKFKGLALPHNLRACWSEPIKGRDGKVLGTYAMYFDCPTHPTDAMLEEFSHASGLISIIMEGEQQRIALNKFSRAIEQAGESIVITNSKGDIEFINPSFTKMTGYTAKNVLGKNPRILKSGMQDLDYYQDLWQTISSGNIWYNDIINRRKDGSHYPAITSIAPIFDDHQHITHYVSIQQDMTTHKDLEEKFYQAQKMEALGTLVGGIAHDFNNILAGISGNLYIAQLELKDRPEVIEKLKAVDRLSVQAADMIKQLLAFARKDSFLLKPFGLKSFMEQLSSWRVSTIPENIDFQQAFCDEELMVKGDATQLQQVLMNLLSNARDAVAHVDHPTIALLIEKVKLNKKFNTSHPTLKGQCVAHIAVKDNGIGISQADKARIFEPFYTTKEVGSGTGLGLAMSDGAIKSHGGILEVESTPRKGTTFHVYLPLLVNEKSNSLPEQQHQVALGHGEWILIADDNETIRLVTTKILKSLGYQVLEAADGVQAVAVFASHQDDIALVIMDMVMPKLGGMEAFERIKALSPKVKVIFATGYDKNEALRGELPSNNCTILPKPYSVVQLSKAIRQQLDG